MTGEFDGISRLTDGSRAESEGPGARSRRFEGRFIQKPARNWTKTVSTEKASEKSRIGSSGAGVQDAGPRATTTPGERAPTRRPDPLSPSEKMLIVGDPPTPVPPAEAWPDGRLHTEVRALRAEMEAMQKFTATL